MTSPATIEVVSFDVQGTLTDSSYSDHFWFEILPREYARFHSLGFKAAGDILKQQFARMGRYDRCYYDVEYWLDTLESACPLEQLLGEEGCQPSFLPGAVEMLKRVSPAFYTIALSSTTRSFLILELGGINDQLDMTLSTLNDLEIPGKPPEAFARVARDLGVSPAVCLHVGDDPLMDIEHACEAGWEAIQWTGDPNPVLDRLFPEE